MGDATFVGEWDLDGGETDLGGLPLPLILVLESTPPPVVREVVEVATLPLDKRRLFSSLTTSSSSSSCVCVCACVCFAYRMSPNGSAGSVDALLGVDPPANTNLDCACDY